MPPVRNRRIFWMVRVDVKIEGPSIQRAISSQENQMSDTQTVKCLDMRCSLTVLRIPFQPLSCGVC